CCCRHSISFRKAHMRSPLSSRRNNSTLFRPAQLRLSSSSFGWEAGESTSKQAEGADLHPDIDQRASRPGVERQLQDCAASRAPQLRSNDDKPLARIEGEAHKTIAVSLGILPV